MPPAVLAPGSDTLFAGRAHELQRLEQELAAVARGQPRVVLVEGEAGIGKTALVEHFLARARARGYRVSGERGEAGLRFGVIEQLFRRAGVEADDATVGPRLVELLTTHAQASQVALVLDDAQWADRESLDVLVYAARRLVGVRVLVLVAARAPDDERLDGLHRLADARLALGALSLDDLRALAAANGVSLAGFALRRLLQHTAGNPAHARAVLEEVPRQAWADPQLPLVVPRAIRATVAQRLAACADEPRRLIEAAAVLGSGCRLADAARLSGNDAGLAALELAGATTLVAAGRTRGVVTVEFTSELFATAVYDQLGPAGAAELHRRAAPLVADADAGAALLHLAAAADGPDERLAGRLERFARAQEQLRRRPQAAAALLAASRLSPRRAQREDRLLRAVDWMLVTSAHGRAQEFADEVAACRPGARRDAILGQYAFSNHRVSETAEWLRSAWEQADPVADPALCAVIAHRRAFDALVNLRDADVAEWAQRAVALAPDDPLAVEWHATLALAWWRQGRRADADAHLTAALSGDGDCDAQLIGMRAWLRFADDELTVSRRELAVAAETELRLGALGIAVAHLNVLARAHYAAGDWDAADAVARRTVALVDELGESSARVFVWWPAVLVPAARGDWERAAHLQARALEEPMDVPDRLLAVGLARAIPAASRGDAAAVLDALEPVAALSPNDALDAPGFWPWHSVYGRALVAAGQHARAEAFLDEHERRAEAVAHGSSAARLAATRGFLEASRGDHVRADAAFARALERIEPLERPYERALIQLAAGQFLRRARQRRRAVALLKCAQEVFAALGARPALERCERELGASGLRPTRRGATGSAVLTPQEHAVATLAAAGKTNREVAAELQLSVKTVEIHLGRAYAKLEIHSRTQLADRIGAADPYARPHQM